MFSPAVRLVLIIACIAVVGIELQSLSYWAALLLFAAACLAWGYFRYGSVWLASSAIRAGRVRRGQRLLDGTRFPRLLARQSRAYYELARGLLAAGARDWVVARLHLLAAVNGGLRTANDRSLAACKLAEVSAHLGDLSEARQCLDRARSEQHKPGVAALIQSVEKQLESAG